MLKFLFDQQVYAPGSTVKGKLLVSLDKKIHVEHIKISVVGKALLYNWSDDPFVRNATQSETYLDMAFYLWRKDSFVKNDRLCAGSHEFPFEFPLPPDIPSSFKDMKGKVEYTCKAWIPSAGRFGKDYGLAVVIPVQRKVLLPASSLHDLLYTERDVAGGLFKFSGRIKLSVELPRSGYLLGEAIPLSGNIWNTSKSSVNLRVFLIQHIAYSNPRCPQAHRKAHYSRLSADIGHFLPSPHVPWTCNKLVIPADLPPSGGTEGCRYFAISYSMKMFMIASGTAKNAIVTFDITVGNCLAIGPCQRAQQIEWYEQTLDLGDSAPTTYQPIPDEPFYLGGATGVDPLVATESYSEFTDALIPEHKTLSATDINTTTMQPPSYQELFQMGEN